MSAIETVVIVKALIQRRVDSKYLVGRSSEWLDNPTRSLKPDLFGGTVDAGENVTEACVREILEEMGIIVDRTSCHEIFRGSFNEYLQGKRATIIIYHVVIDEDPDIKLSWEHDQYYWQTASELKTFDIRMPFQAILRQLVDDRVLPQRL
ncbi:NUDIX domain-containing protein [Candidatus Saccharibacteria bacterium]|nr:MAG: NUDIX domain-containing protein [Candidatus Saccharibacteria bacterium]